MGAEIIGILRELAAEFGLKLRVVSVPSEKNKTDALTRVNKPWLEMLEDSLMRVATACWLEGLELRRLHNMHHMGVNRTLFLTRKVDADVTRKSVQKVVGNCDRCVNPFTQH